MRRLVWGLFLVGLLLQLLLVVRAWRAWPSYPAQRGNSIVSDVIWFNELTVKFLKAPRVVASWKKTGRAADIPGSTLPIILSAPVMATHDLRASVFAVVLFHVAAGALLVTTLVRAFGDRFTAVYLAVFWLSPWRLFHSGFVWEPNLLVLPAAAHVWACWTSREAPSRHASLALGAVLVLTFQIHFSAMFLALLTGLLLLRKQLKISWPFFLAGVAAGSLPLVPTVIALFHGTLLTGSSEGGFLGRGFVYILPLVRALLSWVRMGSLDVGRMNATDCVSCASVALGGGAADAFWCFVYRASGMLGQASVLVALAAGWWWLRRSRAPDRPAPERWLSAYSWNALFALVLAAGFSPITLQTWHVAIAAPAACLPVTAWINACWPFERRWVRALVVVFLLARVPFAVLLAFEYPAFCFVSEEIGRKIQD